MNQTFNVKGMNAEIQEDRVLLSNAVCVKKPNASVIECTPKPAGEKPEEKLEIHSQPIEGV